MSSGKNLLPNTSLVVVLAVRQTPTGWEHLQLRRAEGDYMGGYWSLCRGARLEGEPAPTAALRELHEETGCAPSELYSLGAVELFYSFHFETICQLPAFVAVLAPTDEIRLNEEHDAHRWVADANIDAHLMWPSEDPLIATARKFIFANHPTKSVMRVPLPYTRP